MEYLQKRSDRRMHPGLCHCAPRPEEGLVCMGCVFSFGFCQLCLGFSLVWSVFVRFSFVGLVQGSVLVVPKRNLCLYDFVNEAPEEEDHQDTANDEGQAEESRNTWKSEQRREDIEKQMHKQNQGIPMCSEFFLSDCSFKSLSNHMS